MILFKQIHRLIPTKQCHLILTYMGESIQATKKIKNQSFMYEFISKSLCK